MKWFHNPFRLVRVVGTFFRTGAVDQILKITKVSKLIKFGILFMGKPLIVFGIKGPYKKSPIVRALIALGPAYIKFGQLLSTRPDIVGADLADELKVLQDSLDPFPTTEAKKIVNEELGRPVESIFSSFSDSVAAASIAQVHKATVKETKELVAVKILRPNVEKVFLKDLAALLFLAKFIEFIIPSFRRLKPIEVINHFERLVREELDLRMEISAAAEFAENTKSDQHENKHAYQSTFVLTKLSPYIHPERTMLCLNFKGIQSCRVLSHIGFSDLEFHKPHQPPG